ncbi:intradiol ring-cleavage dioxygenase [Actinokineospora cianjurensis]|uniref:Protocatechuate 3,4-dioxygenase beta subunit n=1 Tax=Actinokineospora cianjurensis TaxID=585224 RepID=A0A421B1K0_9PSEU|nr:intradiol ring-cleavage dioxygenase [Actinokineospora cianjurensis]RLK58161.1 protocatechuate 3,4-dioxygenase beta subunit [Actinokineospora cianjurensis]
MSTMRSHALDDEEGKRVSRRTLVLGGLTLAGVVAACGGEESGTGATTTTRAAAAAAAVGDDPAALLAGATTCALSPTATQGPYYFDADKVRGDIREDKVGTRLDLALKVVDSEGCAAIKDVVVEIWHCDAAGVYSGAESQSTGGGGAGMPSGGMAPPSGGGPGGGGQPPSGGPGGGAPPGGGGGAADLVPTDDKRYLRGAQVTDAQGIVRFTTIWPGWYRGRTVHIHAMVHINNTKALITQLMFDEKLNDAVYTAAPYAGHTGRDTTNDKDSIFKEPMLLTVQSSGAGYLAAKVLGVDADKDGA